jgi:putative flippase GtrA
MQRLRLALTHPLAAASLRYGIAGATVGGFYLALPVVLNRGFGVALQVVIPIAYVLAVSLHFTLQRNFVFRHVERFALSGRQQAGRYVMVGAIQYPTTALATAFLPRTLGISALGTFVCTTLAISLVFFLVLRGLVFHAANAPAVAADELPDVPVGREHRTTGVSG